MRFILGALVLLPLIIYLLVKFILAVALLSFWAFVVGFWVVFLGAVAAVVYTGLRLTSRSRRRSHPTTSRKQYPPSRPSRQ